MALSIQLDRIELVDWRHRATHRDRDLVAWTCFCELIISQSNERMVYLFTKSLAGSGWIGVGSAFEQSMHCMQKRHNVVRRDSTICHNIIVLYSVLGFEFEFEITEVWQHRALAVAPVVIAIRSPVHRMFIPKKSDINSMMQSFVTAWAERARSCFRTRGTESFDDELVKNKTTTISNEDYLIRTPYATK